jgi:hypothetical protein
LRAAPRPLLTLGQILAWADDHHARTGRWPLKASGAVRCNRNENWRALNSALREGNRGLPGGMTLPQLLSEHRGVRNRRAQPPLTVEEILAWADDHYARTGRWPGKSDGAVGAASGEKWNRIDGALQNGSRGLAGGTTLARLLAEHRGVRHLGDLAPLTVELILSWADDEYGQTGRWPTSSDGAVRAAPGEVWRNVAAALGAGSRGLPGGTTLAKLLSEHRGVRNLGALPPLTEAKILAWADAWHARTGQWPGPVAREIPEAPGEKWNCIDVALYSGGRGLPGGDSLCRLLARERGVRNLQNLPPLKVGQILKWARTHHQRTGSWPSYYLAEVTDAPGESWRAINSALRDGGRGLPGGNSLAQLLAERLGVRTRVAVPPLTEKQILAWAEAHRLRTGEWPKVQSGPIAGAPGETWLAVDSALREGLRGLPGGDSVARLLARRRGARYKALAPRLTERKILRWADEHRLRTGQWPGQTSGPVCGEPGETWGAIQRSLLMGQRGLPGGDSLARLLSRRRGLRHHREVPGLTEGQILAWADDHFRRTGKWPGQASGVVPGSGGETWSGIQSALLVGRRGLPGGDTIVKLLARTGRRR